MCYVYSAVMGICRKDNQPRRALHALVVMQRQALSPDVITFSAAISACDKCSQPHKAFGLIRHLGACKDI